ncbi:hypothetical protein CRE_28325 [Caenorhabditis remanei]|uniref:Uncharacterized protein n=2 Tax=Caenorhabditis remanei TaxID=31234 RepID=E3LLU9_CAERE|nr:hypothetical protein CRE_28325 [Caenorhabditis remanei]
MGFPRTKWKILRIIYLFIFLYVIYKTLIFIHVLYLNHQLGAPLDFSEMMSEKDPKKILNDFIKFKNNYIPFDFHQIAIQNEKMIQLHRKEFIRHSIGSQIIIAGGK